ncbi:MAG: DHHW family protein [Candidatus Cohnella colombiensis]|uniref:DHHW family protein n=1 Tax=Candidatus Cohnella colombiensis TaxID=3121368 RepID=A0AA95EVN0_9BACL|nr:MAG: DHHW family protein [Cohnella sp.]
MKHKLNVSVFIIALFGIGLMNLFSPKSTTVSEMEKRELAALPQFSINELFHNNFTIQFDNYFADHFMLRNQLLEVSSSFKELKGFESTDNVQIINRTGGNNTGGNSENGSTASGYLVLGDRSMMLYHFRNAAADNYGKALNRFQTSISPQVNVYSLIVPPAIEFVEDDSYRELSSSAKSGIEYTYGQYNPAIIPVDAYRAIADHSDEYVYFRSDNHWTALGAYYAYTAFMDTIIEPAVPLEDYKSGVISQYLGTSYTSTLAKSVRENPDDVTYYKPATPYSYTYYQKNGKAVERRAVVDPEFAAKGNGAYAVFLGGDHPWGEITTDVGNGKRIVVIKDSYANPFIPFLIPHFEEIYYIDPRSYEGNIVQFVRDKQITDVLFLNSIIVTSYSGIADLLNERMDAVSSIES